MKSKHTASSNKSDALLQLILSMSSAEKRAFSLYVNRYGHSEDVLYYRVFVEINKRKSFDEAVILANVEGLKESQLPNVRANLYRHILKSLRNLYGRLDLYNLVEQFDFARILYDKGLYFQSLDQLQKCKNRAKELQEFFILGDILQFEKFIESQYITSSVGDRAGNLSLKSNNALDRISQTTFLSNKALKLYDWYLKNGYIKNFKEKEKLSSYFYQGMAGLELEKMGFYERIYYHQAYMWYYYIAQDFQNYYRHCLKFVHAFEDYPQMKKVNLVIYMKAVHNICNALFFLNSYDRYRDRFDQFLKIKKKIAPKKANVEGLYYLYYYLHRIDLYILEGRFQASWEWLPELLQLIRENPYNWDQHRILVFYYKIGCLYFGGGDFSRAIDFLNLIINQKSYDIRTDIQSYARILNLISHYELGNERLLQYQVKSVYRYLGKMEELQKVHQYIFAFLRKMPSMKILEVKDHFRELKSQLEGLQNDPIEKRFFLYLDILSWLESKITNETVEGVIQSKFLETRKV